VANRVGLPYDGRDGLEELRFGLLGVVMPASNTLPPADGGAAFF
jgi:hypothetical protein